MKILDTLGKSKKAIGGVIAIIVLVIAIFFAGVHYASGSNNDKITSTTIKNQLTEINELALYSYDYSKVGKFSNKLSFNGWKIPLTQKTFIITYDGSIKAAIDLKQFPDYDQVAERFYDSAKVPYSFDGAAYALPETETFFMLFYRKDILKELDLEVPKTWDEVKTCLSVLSKNNMEVGLPVINVLNADMVYGNFLYQQDGQFYTDDAKASALDSDTGVNTFKEWVKYYTDYTLTREYDFVSRFRTGEVPIGIADYQTYNTLQVSAPEIDGLWGFTTMPGTVMEDGSVNTSSTAGGTGMIILEQSKDKEAAWEYLKWWTSEEIQVQYGREMEGLMGAAARYPTANKAALSKLPWPIQDYKNLEAQLETVKGIPQVPGGYYTARNVNNAFYKVVVDKEVGAREALMDAVRYIDDEITNKRKEFGLDE